MAEFVGGDGPAAVTARACGGLIWRIAHMLTGTAMLGTSWAKTENPIFVLQKLCFSEQIVFHLGFMFLCVFFSFFFPSNFWLCLV